MYDDGKRAMADDLTTSVKEELCRVEVKSQNVRIAEIAAMIRFAGELSIVANKPVLEVELEVRAAAERLRRAMMELFDIRVSLLELGATSSRKAARYLLRITDDVEMVIRRGGLVTRLGVNESGLQYFDPTKILPTAGKATYNGRAFDTDPAHDATLRYTSVFGIRHVPVDITSSRARQSVLVFLRHPHPTSQLVSARYG